MSVKGANYNEVIVLQVLDHCKWTIKTKEGLIEGQGVAQFEKFMARLPKEKNIYVWSYKLNDTITHFGKDWFDFVWRDVKGNSRIAQKGRWQFYSGRNLAGDVPLSAYADFLGIDNTSELEILYYGVEQALNEAYQHSFRNMKKTFAATVKRELLDINVGTWFSGIRLKDEEAFNLYHSVDKGALDGLDEDFEGEMCHVWSYDIKSSYPFELYRNQFPTIGANHVDHDYPLDRFQRLIDRGKLWLACIEFNSLKHKEGKPRLNESLTQTITSVDYELLCDAYEVEIKAIPQIIIHRMKNYLPEPIRNYILGLFEIKETKKGTQAYKLAKKKLNVIFGLFCTESKSNYSMPAVIGIWTAAYARRSLYQVLAAANNSIIYWDTDGVKSVAPIDEIIEKINAERKLPLINLGQWVKEYEGAEFMSFNRKQYYVDGELKCAGLDGTAASKYLKDNNIKPYMGLVIPGNYTGRYTIVNGVREYQNFTLGGNTSC